MAKRLRRDLEGSLAGACGVGAGSGGRLRKGRKKKGRRLRSPPLRVWFDGRYWGVRSWATTSASRAERSGNWGLEPTSGRRFQERAQLG